jgi:hypothetical protein
MYIRGHQEAFHDLRRVTQTRTIQQDNGNRAKDKGRRLYKPTDGRLWASGPCVESCHR